MFSINHACRSKHKREKYIPAARDAWQAGEYPSPNGKYYVNIFLFSPREIMFTWPEKNKMLTRKVDYVFYDRRFVSEVSH